MHLVPASMAPPQGRLGRLAFIAAFVRNPLSVVPKAAYEEDFVGALRGGTPFA